MPTQDRPASRPPSRPSGRRPGPARRAAVFAGLTTVASVLLGLTGPTATAGALPPTATVPSGTTTTASTGAGPVVRGVLERLVVEQEHGDSSAAPGPAAPGPAASAGIPTTWVRTGDGARVPVDPEALRQVPTGSSVAVRLAPRGSDPDAARTVTSVTVLARAATTPRTAASPAVHSVTVVLALPVGARPDATTAAGMARLVNGGVSSYWSRASDGRYSFAVSKSVGWTRLAASCNDVWAVWEEARKRTGFTAGARKHLVVYVPPGANCPTGLATVGSAPDTGGYAIVGGTTVGLVAHELGHNLGLGHSDALACNGTTDAPATTDGFGSGCRRLPYGDWYDVMGISWENVGSLSTAHAYRLGLLAPGAVVTAQGPTRVTLRPVSLRTGVRSLRIVDPAGATYVVEYRPATGVDAWLDTSADWRGLYPGVLLRRLDPEDATQTLLLDPTPTGNAAGDPDVVLRPGQVVGTGSGRVSVAVESVSPGAVTIAVAVDGVWPVLVVEPRGRLIDGRQVTIGQALAAWGATAS